MSKKNFKKRKEGKEKQEKRQMVIDLNDFLAHMEQREWSAQVAAKKLSLKRKDQLKELFLLLDEWVESGKLQKTDSGNYQSSLSNATVEGVVDHVNARFAFITPTQAVGKDADIYVKTNDLKSAVHGDVVLVHVTDYYKGRPEGEVVEVVRRNRTRFAGRMELSERFAFVIPDSKKIYQDFFIYSENLLGAKNNDKVVVEVLKWGSGDKNPVAKVVEILGKSGENNAEIHSIMTEFELPLRFPEKVLEESEKISTTISSDEIKKRRDFRSILTFTIDPEDAKDFDDAISYQKLPNGNTEVGVHIADVTHYVRPNTALDDDAFERATSVYLVDRTVPMLPERLSNELCSLKPNEDKLTFSAVFEMDDNAQVKKAWFGRTIIHSRRRFTYEGAQEVLETGKGDHAAELIHINELAKKLRKERFRKGAVNFETTEVKFKLDENGKVLAVVPKIRKDAHKLIEEFMLLANKAVAEFVYKSGKAKNKNVFVYRTHDFPDPERLKDFSNFAKQFGHKVNPEVEQIASALNHLMDEIENKPEQNVLQSLAVRAMAKAKYTTEANIHFGLAFEHYTHFTSPIRRYPDMMVHRLLQHYLDEGNSVSKSEYEAKCKHSSEREKRAADAERASIKYKQVEYMSMATQKNYAGIITGITDFGMFVEITETKCEGMVRLTDMKDDFYEYDDRSYRLIGRRRKKIYRLGDSLFVKIKATDVDRRTIDLMVVEGE